MVATRTRIAAVIALQATILGGCGGGGGSATSNPPTPDPAPTTMQSAGGIRAMQIGPAATSLLISEDGDLIVTDSTPAFGSGAVVVTNGNEVSGSYTLHTLQITPSSPRVPDQQCVIEGTVRERASLSANISCEDTEGSVTERDVFFLFVPDYSRPSSLEDVAGNYTLSFNRDTNSLSISSDGRIFGMFHNGGTNCVVNGAVEIIDANFSPLRFALDFANCTGAFDEFEGATMSGPGIRNFGISAIPGSIYLVITAEIEGRFRFFSMVYEPV